MLPDFPRIKRKVHELLNAFLLISNITKGLLQDQFHCEKLQKKVEIKGFEGNVDIFRLQKKPTKQRKKRLA